MRQRRPVDVSCVSVGVHKTPPPRQGQGVGLERRRGWCSREALSRWPVGLRGGRRRGDLRGATGPARLERSLRRALRRPFVGGGASTGGNRRKSAALGVARALTGALRSSQAPVSVGSPRLPAVAVWCPLLSAQHRRSPPLLGRGGPGGATCGSLPKRRRRCRLWGLGQRTY